MTRRRTSYHHGNLRRALLDGALQLIRTQGAEALTLRAVARRAGVSQAAPYRHFTGKQALLAAVAEEGFRALTAAMRGAAAPADGALARLRALGLAYVEFATAHPAHFRVMFGRAAADRSAHPSLRAAAEETFGLLVAAVTECQRAGLVRAGNPEELALSAWSMVHGLAALSVDGQLRALGDKGTAARALSATENLFLGLGPR